MNSYPIHPDVKKNMEQILIRSFHPYSFISDDTVETNMSADKFTELYDQAVCEMIGGEEYAFPSEYVEEEDTSFILQSSICLQKYVRVRGGMQINQSEIEKYKTGEFTSSESEKFLYPSIPELNKYLRNVLFRNYYSYELVNENGTVLIKTDADKTAFHKSVVRASCEKYESKNERFFAEEEFQDSAFMKAMLHLLKTEKYSILPNKEILIEK